MPEAQRIRVFLTVPTKTELNKLLKFLDNEMNDPYPTVEVNEGRDNRGRTVWKEVER